MRFNCWINKVVFMFLFEFLVLNCLIGLRSWAHLLSQDEVQILETISNKLKNPHWKISRSSCNGGGGLNMTITEKNTLSNVTCDCSFQNNSLCHVKTIQLKGLNLTGVIPKEFGNLTHLEEIDLTRNYINGSIPATISGAPLRILSLLGNRISGRIPKEIGDIATLQELVLEDNLLEGPLPQNLGNLSNLRRLILSANNFTGTMPETFGNLKNLTDFRIDGTKISGSIPSLIGNWTKLDRLDLQGTSMEGPVPSTISLLKSLTQLRISDLTGSSIPFPNLSNAKQLKRLMLRNCLITGSIPKYLGEMTQLKTLDLSFNRLTGVIPESIENLISGIDYVNIVSSYMASENQQWCVKKGLPCPKKPQYHSLFINCGGEKMTDNGNQYEEDQSSSGSSSFICSSEKWGYSSTGVYMDNEKEGYLTTNIFSLNVSGPDFYKTARIAPISLKYYGLCLKKGSYKVQLHFAEIMFTNNQTYSSLGKRIFDVSIQVSKSVVLILTTSR